MKLCKFAIFKLRLQTKVVPSTNQHNSFPVCQPVEVDSDPDSSGMWMAFATWAYFLNKYSDFADTFFFIAKKKDNQVLSC